MLNKIKVIGMFLKKEQPENKIEDVNSAFQGVEKEMDNSSSRLEADKENKRDYRTHRNSSRRSDRRWPSCRRAR